MWLEVSILSAKALGKTGWMCRLILVFAAPIRGDWRGDSHFYFIRRLGPSIYRSPPKKYQEFQAPPKKIIILATPKISPILHFDLKAAYSVTMNIFRKFYYLFKSFVKV